jgi:hypothetical protein
MFSTRPAPDTPHPAIVRGGGRGRRSPALIRRASSQVGDNLPRRSKKLFRVIRREWRLARRAAPGVRTGCVQRKSEDSLIILQARSPLLWTCSAERLPSQRNRWQTKVMGLTARAERLQSRRNRRQTKLPPLTAQSRSAPRKAKSVTREGFGSDASDTRAFHRRDIAGK